MKKKQNTSSRAASARSTLAAGWPLDWMVEDFDGNNNTVWCACGGSTDGESADLFYRIRQELQDDAHYFIEASDPELVIETGSLHRWRSKKTAGKAIQRYHDSIMRSREELASSANAAVRHGAQAPLSGPTGSAS